MGIGSDSDDLQWFSSEARVIAPIGFGLGGTWQHLSEDVGDADVTADLFDISGAWRWMETPWWTFDLQLGYLGFHDDIGTEDGAHIGMDMTVFPWEPLFLRASTSTGSVGSASVRRHRLAIGGTWHGGAIAIGHRWVDIEHVDLDGWELTASWFY